MARPDEEESPRPYPGAPGTSVEFWTWLAALGDDDLLTQDEAAAMARMPLNTFRYVRNHNRNGPEGFRMGKRVMFTKGNVRQWLKGLADGGKVTPGTAA